MSLLTNLISYWKLDEAAAADATDSHGSNTLLDANSVGTGTGKINGARTFNGTNQFLALADNAALSTGDVSFTFSMWLNAGSLSGNPVAISRRTGVGAGQLEYILYTNASVLKWTVAADANEAAATNFGALSTGTWYHVVVWHDAASDEAGISVNNTTPNITTGVTPPPDLAAEFEIAACVAQSLFWNGLIDEVGFWKRALTAADRSTNFNAGDGLPYPMDGVSVDAASNSGYKAASAGYSWSHVCTGNEQFLAVDVSLLSVPGTSVTGITYNGVALSFIGARSTVSGAGRVECWGLVAPTQGSNTIAVTLSASCISAGTAVSYSQVNQASPTESFNSAQATNVGAADATVTITSVTDQCRMHGALATDDPSVTANNTSRNNVNGAGGSAANEDTPAVTPAGAQAVSYTGVAALATWAIAGYAIRKFGSLSPGVFSGFELTVGPPRSVYSPLKMLAY